MLQDADVLKLKCKFVVELIKFLKRRKYSVSACYKTTLPYFSDSFLATELYTCLTSEDICNLKNKANKYDDNTIDEPEILTCDDQVDIVISTKSTACNVTFSAQNSGNGSAFPYISTLLNNSISQDANINIVSQDCEGTSSETIGQWCNGTPAVCTGNGIQGYTGFSISNIYSASPSAAISYIKLSHVNNNIVTSEFLHVHPTNIAAYTGCSGCESITGSDLYFPTSTIGNATYKLAWEKLMRNIARIYTTGTNIAAEVVTSNAGNFIYR